jgi:acyl-ACP thioesterase
MDNIFTKEFQISSYHLNPKKQARLTALASFFQEIAYHHANQLGFGYSDLQKNKTMWVLSRLRIRINRYPVWDEEIKVETWHRGMERLFGMRDFRILDQAGDVLAVASSAWLIVDMESRRPVRPDESTLQSSKREASVFGEPLEKITMPDTCDELDVHAVVYSDLDVMGHVNNVKYVEWCIDHALPVGSVDAEIGEFEINFLHEALPGDQVVICGSVQPGSDAYFIARRKEDAQEIFRARLCWKYIQGILYPISTRKSP